MLNEHTQLTGTHKGTVCDWKGRHDIGRLMVLIHPRKWSRAVDDEYPTLRSKTKSLKKGTKPCRTVVLPAAYLLPRVITVEKEICLSQLFWWNKTHTHTHANIRLIMSHFPLVSSKLTFLQPTVPLDMSKSLSVCTSWCGCIHRYTPFGPLTIYSK